MHAVEYFRIIFFWKSIDESYMLVNISSNFNNEYHPNIIFHYRLICHISFYTDMKNHVPNDTTDTILEDHEVLYKRKRSRAKRRCKKNYQQGRVFICCKGKSSVSNLWTCQISILIKTDFLKVFFFRQLVLVQRTTIGDIALTSGVKLLILSRETIFCAGLLTISARQKQVFSSGKQKQQMYYVHFTYLN